jgi:hypothetical protein
MEHFGVQARVLPAGECVVVVEIFMGRSINASVDSAAGG